MSGSDFIRTQYYTVSRGLIVSNDYIFVECGEAYSDIELMKHLGIAGYRPAPPDDSPGQPYVGDLLLGRNLFIHIANDGRWAHIADGHHMWLWHCKNLRERIADLATLHNIFTCSFCDVDNSFDFEYYEGGILKRRFVLVVPPFHTEDYNGRVLDYGSALPGEEKVLAVLSGEDKVLEGSDISDKVMAIAGTLGIETDYRKFSIRTYTKPFPKRSILDRLLGIPNPDHRNRWFPWRGI